MLRYTVFLCSLVVYKQLAETSTFLFSQAQFGTLKDYFDALRSSVAQSIDRFPSLSGDFFTYADIDDHVGL